MIYSDNAIKAVESTGLAWIKAARAMKYAKQATDPANYYARGTTVSAVAKAQQAAGDCCDASMCASYYASTTRSEAIYDTAQLAAAVAKQANDIARTAAYWAKNPEGRKT